MIPDYSIQDQKKKGRTRKPEPNVAKERSSHLEVLLEDAPPELCRPLDLSHTGSLAHWISRTVALPTTKSTSTPVPMSASGDHKEDL
jgi:hypothetical protein